MWLLILLKPLSINLTKINSTFSQKVVLWYHQNGRKDLPWQTTTGIHKPYHVWLSEIMLQQTQVVKVKEYFSRFINALPTLPHLATANEQEVLALWSGLGYYNRARNLHKTAQLCVQNHQGTLPSCLSALIELPGIGRSTAAAIMSLAYGQPEPIMDGNVKRVFARHFLVSGEPNKSSTLKKLWQLAEAHREIAEPAAYTQGLMDLGATVCTKNKPQCRQCPLEKSCAAKANAVIDQYPTKKQKVKQQEVDLYTLLSVRENQVGLVLRDAKSIWPSLWFTPLFTSESALRANEPTANHQFSLTHKLTHRILQIHVYTTNETCNSKDFQWVDRHQFDQYPHPKALIHILNHYDNN